MILTTTEQVAGKEIIEYKGLATGEVVAGINFIKDIGAGLRNFFGGRSKGYENEIIQAREEALSELEERARELGANAVVGIKINMEAMGADGGMIIVAVTGTAVVVR